MHALAQCMAARADHKPPELTEQERLDKRAKFMEHELLPYEQASRRKASKWCSPDDPCYCVPSGSVWAAMGGGEDVCDYCTNLFESLNDFLVDWKGWRTTKEGRFELWCAEAARKGLKIEELPIPQALLKLKPKKEGREMLPQDVPSSPSSEDSPEQISFG